jgi:ERCC4-related helicase
MNSDLIPRAYQLEILAKAQEGNVIAAIDTGSGKVRAHGLELAQN